MSPADSDPEPQTPDPEPFTAAAGGFLRHAAVVSALTFASRLLGLVRDRIMGSVFGTSPWHAAFVIGFIVPNLFRRLFGEGALAAAFVPHYARLVETDPALARRFASRCVAGLAVALAGLTLLGEAGLWFALQTDAVAGSGKASAALQMTALMLPYMPLVCGVAFLGAILQVHRRFGPAAAAPVVLNVAMITAAIAAGFLTTATDATNATHGRGGVTLVAVSVLVAGVVQLAWLGFAVRTTAPLGREGVALRDPATSAPVRAMLRTMVPMVIGLGVFQINTLFDQLIAYTLAAPADAGPDTLLHFPAWTGWAPAAYPIQTASVIPLNFAQRLYQFPLGVFGIALATAIFPALARAAAAFPPKTTAPHDSDFADTLRRGLRLALLIGLPSAAGLMVLAVPVCRVVFEAGAFTTRRRRPHRRRAHRLRRGFVGLHPDACPDPGVLRARRRQNPPAGQPGPGGLQPHAEPDPGVAAGRRRPGVEHRDQRQPAGRPAARAAAPARRTPHRSRRAHVVGQNHRAGRRDDRRAVVCVARYRPAGPQPHRQRRAGGRRHRRLGRLRVCGGVGVANAGVELAAAAFFVICFERRKQASR